MSFQLLIAAVNAQVHTLPEIMGINSDAVLVNQCDTDSEEEFAFEGHHIDIVNQSNRGVGLSRNTALSKATADICLFADEDIVYERDYEKTVVEAFLKHPDASVITFNVRVDERRRTYFNEDVHKIGRTNYGRYPAYAIAVRREDILKNDIAFSLLFGGGAKYSNGEDSLFLHDCLEKGLVIYAEVGLLGEETYRESTWFKGFNDKFFFDRGVLYHFLYGKAAWLLGARFILKNRKDMLKEMSFFNAYSLLCRGIREGRMI